MDLTRWYKRSGKFVLASSFSLRKEMIFNEETYDKEHWRIRLDRLQREDFNRIKIPRFNYEMVDNRILFEIEFIKGRQLGACLLYTSPSPRDKRQSRMPSSA